MSKNSRLLFTGVIAAVMLLAAIFVAVDRSNKKGGYDDSGYDSYFHVYEGKFPTLAAVGKLPPLHEAAKSNEALRQAIEEFAKHDDAYLFVNIRTVNSEVARILFLWSGAYAAYPQQTDKTKEKRMYGLRVQHFLRKVHGIPDDEPVKNNPVLGKNAWPRLFNRYKARLIAQSGGKAVFNGGVEYLDIKDKLVTKGGLSRDFFSEYKKFLEQQKNPKPYINNLLVYIDEVKGLDKLSEEEKQIVKNIMNYQRIH